MKYGFPENVSGDKKTFKKPFRNLNKPDVKTVMQKV